MIKIPWVVLFNFRLAVTSLRDRQSVTYMVFGTDVTGTHMHETHIKDEASY